MATTNKDFRVKNGLVVEGSTATVNGSSVLTTASSIDSLSDVNTSGVTNGQVLLYSSGQWIPANSSSGSNTISASDTSPSSPSLGTLWFNTSTGRMYVYYDSYWIESGSPVTSVGLLDGGLPSSTYGGIASIDAGGV